MMLRNRQSNGQIYLKKPINRALLSDIAAGGDS